MQSVLNVRMDSALKKRGDKVLSDHGISVSTAVRALWSQLANTRTLPDFLKNTDEREAAKRQKRDALERLASIGDGAFKDQPDSIALQASLIDEMYDDMLKKYEALQ